MRKVLFFLHLMDERTETLDSELGKHDTDIH